MLIIITFLLDLQIQLDFVREKKDRKIKTIIYLYLQSFNLPTLLTVTVSKQYPDFVIQYMQHDAFFKEV